MAETPNPLAALSQHLEALVACAGAGVVAIESGGTSISGIHWRPGVIVAADEGLGESDEITVITAGGARIAGTLAGRDPTTDIAVIRFEPGDSATAQLGDARALKAGALVMAIGRHADGPIASVGVAGFVGKPWHSQRGGSIDNYIRLDLALAHAAEGGALVDAEGRVLGMTITGTRRRVLAIPRATIDRVADQLLAKGFISRGYLGAALQPVRLGAGDSMLSGVLVRALDPQGPAAAAGLHIGDIITKWANTPISRVHHIMHALGPESVGTTIKLEVLRGGAKTAITIAVAERPRARG